MVCRGRVLSEWRISHSDEAIAGQALSLGSLPTFDLFSSPTPDVRSVVAMSVRVQCVGGVGLAGFVVIQSMVQGRGARWGRWSSVYSVADSEHQEPRSVSTPSSAFRLTSARGFRVPLLLGQQPNNESELHQNGRSRKLGFLAARRLSKGSER